MINYSLTTQRVATGSSYGALPDDDHARVAVEAAIAKLDSEVTVGSVLLFLSSAYAHAPENAIKLAAKAAATPQIFGCCAMSLLTETEWLMDVEGAVAMAFPSDITLHPLKVLERLGVAPKSVLTLTSPNAATIAVNSTKQSQIGSISSDEFGHGPFSIWQSGRIEEHEFSLTAFPETLSPHVLVADGVKRLSNNLHINLAESHTLKQIDQQSAFDSLPKPIREIAKTQPFKLLCAISETNDVRCLDQGYYKLHHLVSVDEHTGEVQLSGKPKAGRHLFWAIRDADEAEKSIQHQLLTLKQTLIETKQQPLFALMFPNMGRGPEFFGGRDRDLDCFQGCFPDTPLIGFYGNGEITPGFKGKSLIKRYSTVIAIYTES